MTLPIRISVYLLLIVLAAVFSHRFYTQFSGRIERSQSQSTTDLDVKLPEDRMGVGKPATGNRAGLGFCAAGFLFSVIGLGILAGRDISKYFAGRALTALYNDDGEPVTDPAYELAEQEWANGNHLDAIRLMRDYLTKNPREQHVALRIAEIYEKDLNNFLAAALEYEEVLTKKLSPERWGWAAIHLCNLYFKLNTMDKAVELLRRIDAEYPQTAAAEKARKRLAMIESGETGGLAGEGQGGAATS